MQLPYPLPNVKSLTLRHRSSHGIMHTSFINKLTILYEIEITRCSQNGSVYISVHNSAIFNRFEKEKHKEMGSSNFTKLGYLSIFLMIVKIRKLN